MFSLILNWRHNVTLAFRSQLLSMRTYHYIKQQYWLILACLSYLFSRPQRCKVKEMKTALVFSPSFAPSYSFWLLSYFYINVFIKTSAYARISVFFVGASFGNFHVENTASVGPIKYILLPKMMSKIAPFYGDVDQFNFSTDGGHIILYCKSGQQSSLEQTMHTVWNWQLSSVILLLYWFAVSNCCLLSLW